MNDDDEVALPKLTLSGQSEVGTSSTLEVMQQTIDSIYFQVQRVGVEDSEFIEVKKEDVTVLIAFLKATTARSIEP